MAGAGKGGAVFVPEGLYRVDRIGIRDTLFYGENREGTIIRALSSGNDGQFILDAMLDRDGVTKNTQGYGWAERLTIDANNTGRSCLRVYGGGVDCNDLNLRNGGIGLATGLPMWSSFRNIHSEKNNVGFYTFHDVPGDIGTSATFQSCWADTCTAFGFHISQLAYSTFLNCVAQDCGTHNFFVEGNLGGVPAVYSLVFIACASEGSGTPFYMKKVRDLTMINPRMISPSNAVDFITLDDGQGSIRDFSTIAPPGPGKYHIKVVNHTSGIGSILLDNSIVTYNPTNDIYFVINGGRTNGQFQAQTYQLRLNSTATVERVSVNGGDVDGYSGLRFFSDDGLRLAAFRRIGTPIFRTNGAINTPAAALNNGDVSFYVDTAASKLKFVVKDSSGNVKSAEIPIS